MRYTPTQLVPSHKNRFKPHAIKEISGWRPVTASNGQEIRLETKSPAFLKDRSDYNKDVRYPDVKLPKMKTEPNLKPAKKNKIEFYLAKIKQEELNYDKKQDFKRTKGENIIIGNIVTKELPKTIDSPHIIQPTAVNQFVPFSPQKITKPQTVSVVNVGTDYKSIKNINSTGPYSTFTNLTNKGFDVNAKIKRHQSLQSDFYGPGRVGPDLAARSSSRLQTVALGDSKKNFLEFFISAASTGEVSSRSETNKKVGSVANSSNTMRSVLESDKNSPITGGNYIKNPRFEGPNIFLCSPTAEEADFRDSSTFIDPEALEKLPWPRGTEKSPETEGILKETENDLSENEIAYDFEQFRYTDRTTPCNPEGKIDFKPSPNQNSSLKMYYNKNNTSNGVKYVKNVQKIEKNEYISTNIYENNLKEDRYASPENEGTKIVVKNLLKPEILQANSLKTLADSKRSKSLDKHSDLIKSSDKNTKNILNQDKINEETKQKTFLDSQSTTKSNKLKYNGSKAIKTPKVSKIKSKKSKKSKLLKSPQPNKSKTQLSDKKKSIVEENSNETDKESSESDEKEDSLPTDNKKIIKVPNIATENLIPNELSALIKDKILESLKKNPSKLETISEKPKKLLKPTKTSKPEFTITLNSDRTVNKDQSSKKSNPEAQEVPEKELNKEKFSNSPEIDSADAQKPKDQSKRQSVLLIQTTKSIRKKGPEKDSADSLASEKASKLSAKKPVPGDTLMAYGAETREKKSTSKSSRRPRRSSNVKYFSRTPSDEDSSNYYSDLESEHADHEDNLPELFDTKSNVKYELKNIEMFKEIMSGIKKSNFLIENKSSPQQSTENIVETVSESDEQEENIDINKEIGGLLRNKSVSLNEFAFSPKVNFKFAPKYQFNPQLDVNDIEINEYNMDTDAFDNYLLKKNFMNTKNTEFIYYKSPDNRNLEVLNLEELLPVQKHRKKLRDLEKIRKREKFMEKHRKNIKILPSYKTTFSNLHPENLQDSLKNPRKSQSTQLSDNWITKTIINPSNDLSPSERIYCRVKDTDDLNYFIIKRRTSPSLISKSIDIQYKALLKLCNN